MGRAAYLVLDREQLPAIRRIDDVAKAVLVLVVFLRDQIALAQAAVWTGKIRDVDLHMVAVIIRLRRIGLAECQILVLADLGARHGGTVVRELGLDPHDLRIEVADALGGPARHVELDIGDAERDPPEAGAIRLVAAQAIAPGTDGLDMVIMLAERKRGALEL